MRSCRASSHLTIEPDSQEAARLVGAEIRARFGAELPRAVLLYASINHDQPLVLETLAATLGPGVGVVGCSSQGMVSDEQVVEDGFVLGAMALGGGALLTATAVERTFQEGSADKGRRLARSLKAQLRGEPGLVTVLYDPLCGADVEQLLAGLHHELACPIIGGGAGQPFGHAVRTYQYFGQEVLSGSVVALGLRGPFRADIGVCHGTVPTGVVMTITKAEGTHILAIDGVPAIECWSRATGYSPAEILNQNLSAAWAVAVERRAAAVSGDTSAAGPPPAYVIRSTFGVDLATGAIVMQTAIPEGTKIMLHHRTTHAVLNGTSVMASELAGKMTGRRPWATLGFECAARTSVFLGHDATVRENLALRAAVAPRTPWLGMMAWGEIAPCLGEPAFHNYTYPLVVLTDGDDHTGHPA
jgi:hypothetical protein